MACLFQSFGQLLGRLKVEESLRLDAVVLATVNCLAIVLAMFAYRLWSKHPLYGQNRGPRVYPIVGSFISSLRNRHRMMDYVTNLVIQTPGHTIRRVLPGGSANFLTANPYTVEHMLKTNFENYPKGEYFKENMNALLGHGIFNADDNLWKIQRKVASYEFTTRSLRDFVLQSTRKEIVIRLLPVLSGAAESGKVLDLQDIFARFAFDNICQLAFGTDPACLAVALPQVKFASAFDDATLSCVKRFQAFPKALWHLKRVMNIGQPRIMGDAVREINDFAMGVIRNRRQELALASARRDGEGLGGKSDLLSKFMTLVDSNQMDILAEGVDCKSSTVDNNKAGSENFSDIFLRDIVISFILAGRDTSMAGLSFFFWQLSLHPEVELAIQEEISSVVTSQPPQSGSADSVDKGCTFSMEDLKNMHYLHAALSESMRLYPPVPSDYKVARNADVWPDGTVIPPNSIVAYSAYAMGRLEDIWGKDCLEFKPMRWLKDGVFVQQSPYKYPIFHAGPRMCLGKDMVMVQMKLICVAIISNFQLSVCKEYKAQPLWSLTMRLKDGLPMTVQCRSISKQMH